MYKLNTYAGRLRALADKHTLAIHTEFNGVRYVNMHTIQSNIWALKNTAFTCTLKAKEAVGATEFDDACEAIGFEGTLRDDLRAALFGNSPCSATICEETIPLHQGRGPC